MQLLNQQDGGTVKEAKNNIFVNGKLPGYTDSSGEYIIHKWVTENSNTIITDINFNSSDFQDPIFFKSAPPIVDGLIEMSSTDFNLNKSSPAIDSGDPKNTPVYDILGNKRPQVPENAVSYTSFENSFSGWSAWSTSADNNKVSLSSDESKTGNQSLKISGRTKDFHSAKFIIDKLEVDNSYSCLLYTSPSPRDTG